MENNNENVGTKWENSVSEGMLKMEDGSESKQIEDYNSFYAKWELLFSRYNWNNDFYPKLLSEVLLGQLLKDVKITKRNIMLDSRINLFVMQPSGTNKNSPLVPFSKVCKALSFRYNSLDDLTDAGMFGSLDRVTISDKIRDPAGKIIKTEQKIEPRQVDGLMHKNISDIVSCEEAGILFKASNRDVGNTLLEHINTALNPIHMGNNTVNKVMKGGTVHCETTASLLMTTVPIDRVNMPLLKSGFFRRILLWYNMIPVKDMLANAKQGRGFIQEKAIDDSSLIKEIADYLNSVRTNMSNKLDSITINPEATNLLNDYADRFSKENAEFSNLYQYTITPILNDYLDKCHVIASHKTILDNRLEVTKEDMQYAIEIINRLLTQMSEFLINSVIKELEFDKLTETRREAAYEMYGILIKEPKEQMSRPLLIDKVRKAKKTVANEVIGWLVQKKLVEYDSVTHIVKKLDKWKM